MARFFCWYSGLFSLIVHALCGPAMAAAAQAPLIVIDEARTANIIRQVPLTGTITSPRVSRLSAQVSGRVESIRVEVGETVKRGDVIVKLDSEIEELTLQASQAATQQARAELTDAQRRFANAKQLRKQKSVSQNEVDLREAEVQINSAALQRQLAEQRKQQALLKRHVVTAPFAGVISERSTEIGEWIEPGTSIVTLIAINTLRIEFRVPQEFFRLINEQSRVSVSLDAYPGREFTGKIDVLVPVSDPSARTFLIHVLVDSGDSMITPGMSVHGKLHLHTDKQGVIISRDALLRYPDGRVTVWVVNTTGKDITVSERLVTVGSSFDGKVSILGGLQAGDKVVVQGNESLQEGQAVRIHTQQ